MRERLPPLARRWSTITGLEARAHALRVEARGEMIAGKGVAVRRHPVIGEGGRSRQDKPGPIAPPRRRRLERIAAAATVVVLMTETVLLKFIGPLGAGVSRLRYVFGPIHAQLIGRCPLAGARGSRLLRRERPAMSGSGCRAARGFVKIACTTRLLACGMMSATGGP
jgi:hypothetical protein